MKPHIPYAFAAALAAGAASLAGAALPEVSFVQEPVASGVKTEGPDADLVDRVVQALNADASLKNTKFTVSAENGNVLLTGAASTREQAEKAGQLANGQVGKGTVVNAILDDQT